MVMEDEKMFLGQQTVVDSYGEVLLFGLKYTCFYKFVLKVRLWCKDLHFSYRII
jgi:hypothetical protein